MVQSACRRRSVVFYIRAVIIRSFILFIGLVVAQGALAQRVQLERLSYKTYADTIRKPRAIGLGAGTVALWTGSVVGLNELWYAKEPRSAFHFFDDNSEWMQQDKYGHFLTSYAIGYYYTDMMRWAGFNRKTSIWTGGFMGSFYLIGIEMLDGFSEAWGFSYGDFAANTAGSLVFIGQELLWNEQRIIPKISYHPTRYAQYRPDLLGSNFGERLMKDYNGQTYWLSVNIYSFLKEESKFPRWVNVAVGFGATGMIGGNANPRANEAGVPFPQFDRQRQFYLSLDVDLTKVRTNKKWLRTVFKAVSLIKMPFPAMRIGTVDGVQFEPFFF
jgi:hypothetical protein